MSVDYKKLRHAIKKIAGTPDDISEIMFGTVVSVNKEARTCVVNPTTGHSTQLTGVWLMPEVNDGELKIPSVNSTVAVSISKQMDPIVYAWTELDEWLLVINGKVMVDFLAGQIQLGDGSFGGLVEVVNLVSKLNNLEDWINTFIPIFNALTLPVSGATAGPPVTPLTNTLTPTVRNNIENTKITHGSC